uniref:CTP synthase n=1 Tax=Dermatophagoides pteronyssinus TaxID=6956 RepID=A0A6P6XYR8_DERPT|nr:CTP synthase-like [Dermatophagoides pteronyssinus]
MFDHAVLHRVRGSISGLGKGTLVSSLAILLRDIGLKLTAIKVDPYLNFDAGTISPFEHGEVFVLKDGCETDLDLGNYERALNIELSSSNCITTGKIFSTVFNAERKGSYLGKTVQMVPHVTDCIQEMFSQLAESEECYDVCLVEIGGTVGDIESSLYLEAIQQFVHRRGADNVSLCHLVFVPTVSAEQKTKCAQHSFRALRESGLFPSFIFARSTDPLTQQSLSKLSTFSGVSQERIFSCYDVSNLYFYHSSNDTYISVVKAVEHASFRLNIPIKLVNISAELLEKDADPKQAEEVYETLCSCHAVLIPGGFGERGTAGMIKAIWHARTHDIPILGICLGMQLMCIEAAQNVLGYSNANSEEFGATDPDNFIMFLPDSSREIYGGTMRLGEHATSILSETSLAYEIYKRKTVHERHRHRFEFNKLYENLFADAGFVFSGIDVSNQRYEIIERPGHAFFFGTQFHPEYKSSLENPSEVFLAFAAASQRSKQKADAKRQII